MPTQIRPQGIRAQSDARPPTTLLDGGMGRELERRGAPFRQPEWSALALSLAPESVCDIHLDYIKAGATVITVNSYAVTPYHLGVTSTASAAPIIAPVKIAGCLPPLFGSYRPDLFDPKQAPVIARPLLAAQIDYVDIWLVETQSSIIEATTWQQLITEFTENENKATPKPIWIAFTLDDSQLDIADNSSEEKSGKPTPTLRSGETVAEAVRAMMALDVTAILFNCSQPEVMDSALQVAKAIVNEAGGTQQLGVYANAFASKQVHKQANAQLRQIRTDTTPEHYLKWATLWQASGADIIGGCCGIGVEHIALLAQHIKDTP